MTKYILLMTLLAAAGCYERPPLTESQKTLLAQLTLDRRAFMEGCVAQDNEYSSDFHRCQSEMMDKFDAKPAPSPAPCQGRGRGGSGSRVLETAAGTAMGVGAAKLLLGR
jgi:hypothetical protein